MNFVPLNDAANQVMVGVRVLLAAPVVVVEVVRGVVMEDVVAASSLK